MVIFSPGPANISERVRNALLSADIYHRDSEFAELLTDVRKMVLEMCQVDKDYKSVIFNGSGTLAIESVIASLGGYNKKILIISNGIYGERAAEIARVYRINIEEVKLPWGNPIDLNQIYKKLKRDEIGAVYVVHHETTTGILNPLADISHMAQDRKKLVLVDGISSIAGETLDIDGWGIDAIVGSANKCIRGVPGISFTVASKRFLGLINKCRTHSYYSHLLKHLEAEEKGEPLFTPSIQVLYAFRETLKELLENGGSEARINEYKAITRTLRKGLKKINMRFYLPEDIMSNTMTIVYLPSGYDYNILHRCLKERGYVICSSVGKLAKDTFRLGTVGLITKQDIVRFLDDFEKIL